MFYFLSSKQIAVVHLAELFSLSVLNIFILKCECGRLRYYWQVSAVPIEIECNFGAVHTLNLLLTLRNCNISYLVCLSDASQSLNREIPHRLAKVRSGYREPVSTLIPHSHLCVEPEPEAKSLG